MNRQGKAVRSPVSGPDSRPDSGRPPQSRPVRPSGSRGRVRHGNGASDHDKQQEDQGTSSHPYEDVDAAKRYATQREGQGTSSRPYEDVDAVKRYATQRGDQGTSSHKYEDVDGQKRYATSPGATPMRRHEPYWLSRADAAAKIPNPMYPSIAGTTTKPQPQSLRSRADAAAKMINPIYASGSDRTYPGGASGRRGVRARRSYLAAGIAVLLSVVAVGLAPLTFSNKQEISQLSTTLKRDLRQLATTFGALKRNLDNERNRTAALEQRLHEIEKTLRYTIWHGTCYKAFATRKTFDQAAEACRADGGTLAMPRDAETDAFLISLHDSVGDGFWFGLHDQCEEGRFEWLDGSVLGSYSSWGQKQPDNFGGNEDCVIYSSVWKDKWDDAMCKKLLNFICQAAPGCAGVSPLLCSGSPTIRSQTN
ncbi:PREDICTED: C-type lectin domain family 4 member K-like [Branchiostoma belcheri]|uniref:C-type lectin domain family 4 member K-like n=1 Tax=Branchiostoma belcheri TaxID=7741 RepID=A0A6P4XCS1_BRABE|nr:PREDICTED: C-type lectin domain family 4 member K-like [Branchiostoma belcheri]